MIKPEPVLPAVRRQISASADGRSNPNSTPGSRSRPTPRRPRCSGRAAPLDRTHKPLLLRTTRRGFRTVGASSVPPDSMRRTWAPDAESSPASTHPAVPAPTNDIVVRWHIGKGLRINLDGAAEFLRAATDVTDGFIREGAVLGETVHEPGDVLVLSYLVGLPNGCLVSGHMTVLLKKQMHWIRRFEADGDGPTRRLPPGARAPLAAPERRGQRTRW
jgi:hypothetical protein